MRPEKMQGLTTGEVSKMLGISRSRVVGFFERRILTGSKNPITGRVVIDPKSVKTLKRIWAITGVTQKEGKR
jgi:hypothetical protein